MSTCWTSCMISSTGQQCRITWSSTSRDVVGVTGSRHPHHKELYPILDMYPLELVHTDFLMIDNPMNRKDMNVLVITDHFNRYAQAIITTLQTAQVTAWALWDRFFTHYGFPASILSVQGHNFESNLIKELCDLGGICRITTPYHQQGNGQWQMVQFHFDKHDKDTTGWRQIPLKGFHPHHGPCLQLHEKQCNWIWPILLNVWVKAKVRPWSPVWTTNGGTAAQGTSWLCKLAGGQTAFGLQFSPGNAGTRGQTS